MKSGILALVFLLSLNGFASENKIQKYNCLMNKSEALKVYMVEDNGAKQVSVSVDHFLFGENEVVRLHQPSIIEYGDVFMVSENYGRSGYFFMRFENGKKASEVDIGDALGMVDDNRFNADRGFGYSPGQLSFIANCSKVN
jgi:hypothetical protein